MNERGGFFWFDPFGNAPADAEVSGTAGGPIAWGGTPSWPFERQESELPFLSLLSHQSFWRRRPRHEPHFQFFTDRDPDAPRPPEETRITVTRHYVILAPDTPQERTESP